MARRTTIAKTTAIKQQQSSSSSTRVWLNASCSKHLNYQQYNQRAEKEININEAIQAHIHTDYTYTHTHIKLYIHTLTHTYINFFSARLCVRVFAPQLCVSSSITLTLRALFAGSSFYPPLAALTYFCEQLLHNSSAINHSHFTSVSSSTSPLDCLLLRVADNSSTPVFLRP